MRDRPLWCSSAGTLHKSQQLFRDDARDDLLEALAMGGQAAKNGDDGTNDLLSDVIRTNELQVWFLSEQRAISRASKAR